MRGFLNRLVSIADEPTDDDDLRLRRRMGVVAGYVTIPAALTVIPLSPDAALGMGLGLGLSIFAAANLILLARTHRFERYVVALISMGMPFTVVANVLNGGVAAGGAGMMWGFLVPLYAIIALGPHQATKWFVIFLVGLFGFVAIDPLVISRITPPPYQTRLVAMPSASPVRVPSPSSCCATRISVDARRRRAPTSCSTTPSQSRSPGA